MFKELFLLQCIQDGCISSFTSSPDTRTSGMMTRVTVAASTMIPFSSLAAEPHQHWSAYEVKGNVLIPVAHPVTH